MNEVTIEQVHRALQRIIDNRERVVLNFAINYAIAGMAIKNPYELRVQVLYVLYNINNWRGAEARSVKRELRQFCNEQSGKVVKRRKRPLVKGVEPLTPDQFVDMNNEDMR